MDYKVYDAHTHEHLPGVPNQELCDTGGKVVYAYHASHTEEKWVRMPSNTRLCAGVRAVYVL